MKLRIEGEHYTFCVEVNDRLALMELVQGWWEVTDGTGAQLMPRFLRKDTVGAIVHVVRWLKEKADLTWRCHICKRERPDRFIAVLSTDVSSEHGLTPGTMTQNVRYCNDNPECLEKAKTFRFYESNKRV